MNLEELERLLAKAKLLRYFKSGVATRLNHEEWEAVSALTNAAPRLLALARAGEQMAIAIDEMASQADLFASEKGGTYKYLAMLLHAKGDTALAAWKAAWGDAP